MAPVSIARRRFAGRQPL